MITTPVRTHYSASLPPGWELRASSGNPAGEPPPGSHWAIDHVTGASTPIQRSPAAAIRAAWALRARLARLIADSR